MSRFLIEIPHASEHAACVKSLHALQTYGSHFVSHVEYGCEEGVHVGYLIADFDSRAEAQQVVPPEFRAEARVVKLRTYTPEQIKAMMAKLET